MQFDVLPVINEYPSSFEPFRAQYDHPFAAKLAFKRSQWVYLRTRLAEAQNWKCCFCGCVMTELRNKSNSATVEHVTPKDFGGTDDPENLVASCYHCNNKRGTLDAYTFTFTLQIVNEEEIKKHTKLQAKIRRYVKRAKKFAKIDFKISDRVRTFEDWFSTLTLCDEGRKLFLEEFRI